MPSEPTDFERLLVRASAEALSGSAASLAPRYHPILNGVPYRAFRQSIGIEDRRELGTFFSSRELASELAASLRATMQPGGLALDPTCGIGDLLIAFAEELPIATTLMATLEQWGKQLAGIDKRADLVAMAKARLVALARSRGNFDEPITSLDYIFPHIIVGDMLSELDCLRRADGFLFNPPFGGTCDHSILQWGAGKLSAAAIFLDLLVSTRKPSAPIAAVLPEVLRCGSRYARFRLRISDAGLIGSFKSRGRFDTWTDVDVFTTLLTSGTGELWTTEPPAIATIADHFDVRVGPVVPHRHVPRGPWQRYICAKTVPPWSAGFTPTASRRFDGTVFMPPFVVVRRTSSPSDRKRAVGSIILGERSVAVENHLIVLLPKDGRVTSCTALLGVLAADATSEYLNHTIRCRHLTTGSVRGMPWELPT